MKAYGGIEVKLHEFLHSTLERVVYYVLRSGRFAPTKESSLEAGSCSGSHESPLLYETRNFIIMIT
jgi:hypothetical protein